VILLSGENLNGELVFDRRYRTSILFAIGAVGIVSHVEVQFVIVPTLLLKIQISSGCIRHATRCLVGERYEERPSVRVLGRFVNSQFQTSSPNLESEHAIPKVGLWRSRASCHDDELCGVESFQLRSDSVARVGWKIVQSFEVGAFGWRNGGIYIVLQKGVLVDAER